MRLLYLAEDIPNRHPVHGNGSSMISFELLRHLPEDVELDLLTFVGAVPLSDELRARVRRLDLLPLPSSRVLHLRAVAGRAQVGAVQRDRAHVRRLVAERSQDADVTLLHGPHVLALAPAVRGAVAAQVVDPWSQRTAMEAGMAQPPYRMWLRWRSRRALSLERSLPARLRLLTVSATDAQRWAAALDRPVHAVPNGVDAPAARGTRTRGTPTLVFAGSLDYAPNVESARRLVDDVAPLVRQEVPEVRVVVAGRKPTRAVRALGARGAEVLADVPSMPDLLAECDVAVFADRHGVGTRNSVQEALAAGLHVVATPSAARGIPPHARLEVHDCDPALARAAARALLRPADGEPAPLRSWQQMADDYVAHLHATQRLGPG